MGNHPGAEEIPMTRALALGARFRVPPLREQQIHIAVADLLRQFADERWQWTHLPFGGKREVQTGALLKQMGVRPGWPDFIFVGPFGWLAFLELKSSTGTLDPHQVSFFQTMRARGIECRVARSIEDAAVALGQWGVIPIKIAEQVSRRSLAITVP